MSKKFNRRGQGIALEFSTKERNTAEGAGTESAVSAPQNQTSNRREQDSTPPPIRFVKRQKKPKPSGRLIPEGPYPEAMCVEASHEWHKLYKRWNAVLKFVSESWPEGAPIEAHVGMREDRDAPQLDPDHWLAVALGRCNASDTSALLGRLFSVTVRTVKRPSNAKVDRPPSEWYSVVDSAVLLDDAEADGNTVAGLFGTFSPSET